MLYIIAVFGICFVLLYAKRSEPWHPLFWFPTLYALYNCWFAMWQYIDGTVQITTLNQIGLIALCGLLGVLIGVFVASLSGLRGVNTGFPPPGGIYNIKAWPGEAIQFYVVVAALSGIMVYAYASGIASKREWKDLYMPGAGAIFAAAYILVVRQCLLYGYANDARSLSTFYIALFVSVAAWLLLGERELIFSIGLLFAIIIVSKYKQVAVGVYISSVLAAILILPVSTALKASIAEGTVRPSNYTEEVKRGEFSSAGRNIGILLDNHVYITGHEVLRRELKRSVAFSVFGGETESMAAWYNREFRRHLLIHGSSGWGFTMMGAGYLVGGYGGVVAYGMVMGGILGVLYRFSRSSAWCFVVYCVAMPLAVYSQRQDLSYFLGGVLKQGGLVALLMVVFAVLVSRPNKRSLSGYDRNP
jgi:hypothetical protein